MSVCFVSCHTGFFFFCWVEKYSGLKYVMIIGSSSVASFGKKNLKHLLHVSAISNSVKGTNMACQYVSSFTIIMYSFVIFNSLREPKFISPVVFIWFAPHFFFFLGERWLFCLRILAPN